ncbi:MAG TPA: alkaline phosphatase family protein [Jatrophihabitans sp.]|nr:alkaline phosphatase family protein [Jatrophihabitans sp.]
MRAPKQTRSRSAGLGGIAAAATAAALAVAVPAGATSTRAGATTTPIKHLVVIYQENHSFDNYFGTYPHAANPPGEPAFHAQRGTPTVNGLTHELLTDNPNLANPTRLDRSQEITCDNNHNYVPMQEAYDGGLLDKFVQSVGPTATGCDPTLTMDYYDGNTVTALWNYAQRFAMSDDNFASTFGPSVPQALNLISGQTHGLVTSAPTTAVANGTLIANLPPAHDDCDASGAVNPTTLQMTGRNIGDLLNARGVTWGWFTGGFKPTAVVDGKAVCGSTHDNIAGVPQNDYFNGEDDPFQFYPSTNNQHHVPPSSPAMVGRSDQADHQYDLSDFWTAAEHGRMPAVSFLRAPSYQQGHPGYSDPLDEQHFLVDTLNRLQRLPTWRSTAVIITWDESDGWYDHVMPPIVNPSDDPVNDVLAGPGMCGTPKPGAYLDRCGYGPRIPVLVISPFSRSNFVDHQITAQSSIIRFIEDNWRLGSIGDQSLDTRSGTLNAMFDFRHPHPAKLILNPITGEVAHR